MKFEEILPALRAGKKIRREYWVSYRKYIYLYFENSNDCFKLCFHKNNSEDDEMWNFLSIVDLIADDWEIFKEPQKVKLRDLTPEQYKEWRADNCLCPARIELCDDCPFNQVRCYPDPDDNPRYLNKDIFNDKFLDQEIEIRRD